MDHTLEAGAVKEQLLKEGPYDYVFDTIGGAEVTTLLGDVLAKQGGGVIYSTFVTREEWAVPEGVERKAFSYPGMLQADEELYAWFNAMFGPALEQGLILPTKAEKIRTLARAGYLRADIARLLGVRYQHVRRVLLDAGMTGGTTREVVVEREPFVAEIVLDDETPGSTRSDVLLSAGFRHVDFEGGRLAGRALDGNPRAVGVGDDRGGDAGIGGVDGADEAGERVVGRIDRDGRAAARGSERERALAHRRPAAGEVGRDELGGG